MFNKTLLGILSASVVCLGTVTAFNGDATYFHTGLGNCGFTTQDTDFIAAISTIEYNNGARCNQMVRVFYQGKSVDVRVVDRCPGCSQFSIDLSPSAFQTLAPLDAGRIQVSWQYL